MGIPVFSGYLSLKELISAIAHSRCRCCLLVDNQFRLLKIVTQGDVLRFAESESDSDEALNAMLDARANDLVGAGKYERNAQGPDY